MQSLLSTLPTEELEQMLSDANIDVTKLINPQKGKLLLFNKATEAFPREICLETKEVYTDPELDLIDVEIQTDQIKLAQPVIHVTESDIFSAD